MEEMSTFTIIVTKHEKAYCSTFYSKLELKIIRYEYRQTLQIHIKNIYKSQHIFSFMRIYKK